MSVPPSFSCEQFVVFDDVLPTASFEELWRHLEFAPLKPVDVGVPYSPWHLTDGRPLKGDSSHATSDWVGSPAPVGGERSSAPGVFPTGTPIDHVLAALLAVAPSLESWIGRPGHDWVVSTATPWIYPSGSGLSWHSDGAGYTGAYIYYAHPTWEAQWGGELLVAHPSCRLSYPASPDDASEADERRAYRFDKRQMSDHLLRVGTGSVVMAKPNRLVVLQGGNPHKITRVDGAAGDHVRASVAGFFVTPDMMRRSAERQGVQVTVGPAST